MHRELPEEVHNRRRALRQREPQDERRQQHGQHFCEEDHNLHLEKVPKLFMHGLRMEAVLPLIRHVMRVADHFLNELLGVVYSVVVWDHPASDGED